MSEITHPQESELDERRESPIGKLEFGVGVLRFDTDPNLTDLLRDLIDVIKSQDAEIKSLRERIAGIQADIIREIR